MLNSTEHEISTAHKKLKYQQMKKFLALSPSDVVFIMLINVKMPTIVGILTFMSRINFMLSWVDLFVWFDSLRPLNNLSVMRDGSSWVEPVLS